MSCASLPDREWGPPGGPSPGLPWPGCRGLPGAPPAALSGQGCTVGSEGASGLERGGDLPPSSPEPVASVPQMSFNIEVTEFLRQVI